MSWINLARDVVARHSARTFDPETDAPMDVDPCDLYEDPDPDARGVILDAFTASALVGVFDKLSHVNRCRFDGMPILRAVDVAWKVIR